MIGCKITITGGTFMRIYWQHTLVTRNELRGAAPPEDLRRIMPAGANIEIFIGQNKVVVCANGPIEPVFNEQPLTKGQAGVALLGRGYRRMLRVGDLSFEIEAIDSTTNKEDNPLQQP